MGLMMLFDAENLFPLWILLLAAMGLTIWEGHERQLGVVVTLWWVLLVALVHVIGYLGMRGWFAWKQK